MEKLNDRRESALWIVKTDGTRNRFLAKGSGARWSPTGDRIIYTAPFVVPAIGGTPRQLTSGKYDSAGSEWTPDSKSILFSGLRTEDGHYQRREGDLCRERGGRVHQAAHVEKGAGRQSRVSPDGTRVAYTSMTGRKARGSTRRCT